ncbi:MAG: hypothetical protein PUD59_03685 [bacterium]|nr:hypothetical protein [bacterium]
MEREHSSRIIAIVALFVAIIGLSIGFAAFSNNLTIKSNATVTPNESDFDVNFSSSNTSELDGAVSGIGTNSATAEDATIDNSDAPTITGLKANFTEPGQKVTYSFFAHNAGKYVAYLNNVIYSNVNGETSTKVCTPGVDTDATMVEAACNGISVSVKVGNETYTGSVDSIENHSLELDGYEDVVVTIEYASSASRADGDFEVAFGDIKLIYDSVD